MVFLVPFLSSDANFPPFKCTAVKNCAPWFQIFSILATVGLVINPSTKEHASPCCCVLHTFSNTILIFEVPSCHEASMVQGMRDDR